MDDGLNKLDSDMEDNLKRKKYVYGHAASVRETAEHRTPAHI